MDGAWYCYRASSCTAMLTDNLYITTESKGSPIDHSHPDFSLPALGLLEHPFCSESLSHAWRRWEYLITEIVYRICQVVAIPSWNFVHLPQTSPSCLHRFSPCLALRWRSTQRNGHPFVTQSLPFGWTLFFVAGTKIINSCLVGASIVVGIIASVVVYRLVQNQLKHLKGIPGDIEELAAEAVDDADEGAPLLNNFSSESVDRWRSLTSWINPIFKLSVLYYYLFIGVGKWTCR